MNLFVNTINFASLSHNSLSFISNLQKKTMAIAIAILAGLAFAYVLIQRAYAKKMEKDTPEIAKEILTPKSSSRLSPELIENLEKETGLDEGLWTISNTGMTSLLAYCAFDESLPKGLIDSLKLPFEAANPLPPENLNDLLQKLAFEALTLKNDHARASLTRPNNPNQSTFDEKYIKDGFPQNTPLCLLVKAGNLEGSQAILPVYEKKDLLFTTPRGNSALHLAVITGQILLAKAILDRANELGIAEELVGLKNGAGKTVNDMFPLFIDKKLTYNNFLETVNPFLGAEINKTSISKKSDFIHQVRQLIFPELTKIAGRHIGLKDVEGKNFLTLMNELSKKDIKPTKSATTDEKIEEIKDRESKIKKEPLSREDPFGNTYEGDFDENFNGQGKMTNLINDIREGEFKNGFLNGKGKVNYANGNYEEGFFESNKLKKGRGKIKNGFGTREGEFENSLLVKGKIAYPSGMICEGTFKNGLLHGQGENCHNNTVKTGEFENGLLRRGKISFPNGDIHEGEFFKDLLMGKGKITYANGTTEEGNFVSGKLIKDKDDKIKKLTGYRKTFSQAFTGKFEIDNLPIYPEIDIVKNFPIIEKMTHPVMKGTFSSLEGKLKGEFIAINVFCEKTKKEDLFLLLSHAKNPNEWWQRQHVSQPLFFIESQSGTTSTTFTDLNGDLIDSQKKNFQSFQKLLKEGKSQDVNGETWYLVEYSGADL